MGNCLRPNWNNILLKKNKAISFIFFSSFHALSIKITFLDLQNFIPQLIVYLFPRVSLIENNLPNHLNHLRSLTN